MKNQFTCRSFFSLAICLSLFLCIGCGGSEEAADMETPMAAAATTVMPANSTEFTYPPDEAWIRLTEEEVAELMQLEIPQRWNFYLHTDPALYHKYFAATLFQRFGDIPQVRCIAEYERQPEKGWTTDPTRLIAYFEALYFLFPSEANRRTVEKLKKPMEEEKERLFLDRLRRESPEVWIKHKRAALIKIHGDIPNVRIVVEFLRKLELHRHRTNQECHAFFHAYRELYPYSGKNSTAPLPSRYESYAQLEAVHQIGRLDAVSLHRLGKYREARAEGISFYDINWDDD